MFDKEKSNEKLFVIYAKALARGVILSVILLLFASLVFYFTNLNEAFMNTAVWVITVLSICYASIYGTRKIGVKGFLHGAVIGVLYIVVLAIIAFLVEKGQVNILSYVVMLVMSIVVGMLSGMIGMILKK
jgi:putative membrane protein (TIGR04086 family)